MVTANNYMFRPLTGHHQVVHIVKMGEGGGCLYNIQCNFCVMTRFHASYDERNLVIRQKLHCILYRPPLPHFH